MLGLCAGLLLVALPLPSVTHGDPLPLDQQANQALGLRASQVEPVSFQGTPGQAVEAFFILDGTPLRLALAPHSVRARDFAVRSQAADGSWTEHDAGPVRTLRGEVVGRPGSQVAGAWHDEGLYAQVRLADGGLFWIQPALPHVLTAGPFDHVFYRNDDVLAGSDTCGNDTLADELAGIDLHDPQAESLQRGTGPALGHYIAEISCDADFQFFQDWGSVQGTQDRIELILNTVNVQYERDVNITHQLGTVLVRTSSTQPYNATDPDSLLLQFNNHWSTAQAGIQRDVAHLFTGRNLNGSVIGIAYISGLCSPIGYGLSQSTQSSFACVTDLTAHELGHNWSAQHCNCTNYTMHPNLRCRNQFNPVGTIPSIRQYRNIVTCLERECFETASATPRNAGTNPASLTVSTPLMGQPWILSVDTSSTPHLLGSVLAFKDPTQIPLPNGSILLGLPPELLNLQFQLGPMVQYSLAIPFDANLCGYTFTAQGIHYLLPGGTGEYVLTNAYDCVIGT